MRNKFKSSCFLVFILFITSTGFAQNAETQKTISDTSSSSNLHAVPNLVVYKKTFLKDSANIISQYAFAEKCRLNSDYTIAEYWYSKVYKNDATGKQFPECSFWLATMKKDASNYDEAKTLFIEYVNKNEKNNQTYFFKKAQQEIASCELAQQLMFNPDTRIKIKHLDTTINSKLSEYSPFEIDSILYFSSLRDSRDRDIKNQLNNNKIYKSVQGDSAWGKAILLDSVFNEMKINNASISFNNDKTKMYISRCKLKEDLQFMCDIYSSELNNNVWSPLKKLPPHINPEGLITTQPSTGNLKGQEVLFFSSNRNGGEGNMDIWYSKINPDGSYETPVNAGKNINSIEDEITPFYNAPTQELFFSSTWHKGLGGFDIFKSTYSNSTFAEPKNIGIPINSNYNDIYFSINTKKTNAFLSSNRKGSYYEEKENCCNDIYMFAIPFDSSAIKAKQKVIADSITMITLMEKAKEQLGASMSTQVKSASTVGQMQQMIPIALFFHNDEPDRQSISTKTLLNYEETYKIYATKRALYKRVLTKGMRAKKESESNKQMDAIYRAVQKGKMSREDFATALSKLMQENKSDEINSTDNEVDRYFDSVDEGMKNLNSFAQLLVKALKEGEKITITITSHCSPLASNRYNYSLAKRRVGSVKNYFKKYENGVLATFIKDGSIKFVEEDIGETKYNSKISDSFKDVKNSVFSLEAAHERNVQISVISSGK